MANKFSQSISENELNDLLNRAFTELNFDDAGNAAMLEAVSVNALQNTALVSQGIAYNYKLIASISLVLGISIVSVFLLGKKEKPQIPQHQIIYVDRNDSIESVNSIMENPQVHTLPMQTPKARKPGQQTVVISSPDRQEPAWRPLDMGLTDDTIFSQEDNTEKREREEYIFPVLTPKEIKANEKEKRRLIKVATRITRDKRDDVARIPASPDGSIGNFYMGGGEVTNNEYRTFLFDLLINDRKEEFLKAKPVQTLWKNVEGLSVFDTLEKVYFSDKKYNFFPVVNVSAEGAEMYCRWLQEGVDAARLNDGKIPKMEIRLPYEKEWLYAASAGRKNAVYPWPIDSVQNRVNLFLANFCIQKLKEKFRQPIIYPRRKVNFDNYTSAGMALNDPTIATIDVWSYNPSAFGLYGISGNASEMVYADNTKKIKVKGGNWASDFEHLKLTSEDEFEGKAYPSPKIGFRICAFVK